MGRLFSIRTVYVLVTIAAAVISGTYYLMKLRQECGADPLLRCIKQALGAAPPVTAKEEPRGAADEVRWVAAEKARTGDEAHKPVVSRDGEDAKRKVREPRGLAEVTRPRDQSHDRREVPGLRGSWRGAYVCAQGPTGLTLTIDGAADALTAVFDFYPLAENPNVPAGRFRMAGAFDSRSRVLVLRPGEWIVRPGIYMTVGIRAEVDLDAGTLSGTITDSACSSIRLRRLQSAGIGPGSQR
jgi:hypothetical protein